MTVESLSGFVFPGQGTQKNIPGMAEELFSHLDPDIQQIAELTYEEAADVLGLAPGKLFQNEVGQLHRPSFTEPAILTVSIAAFRALGYYDINPDIVAGHSMGEISAVVAAEALSFEQALRLAKNRGEFMKEAGDLAPGKMAVILGLTLKEIEEICEQFGVEVANINGERQIVISGKNDSVVYASKLIRKNGNRVIDLEVSIAAHSSLMEPAREQMELVLQKEKIVHPRIPIIQNSTGDYATTGEQVRRGLIDQVTGRVLWLDTIRRMSTDGVSEYTEVGPGRVLSGIIRRIDPSATIQHVQDILNESE